MIDGGHVAFGYWHSTSEINDGAWHMIALSHDAGGNDRTGYIDGAMESLEDGTPPAFGFSTVPFVGVGSSPCPAGYFSGEIDDIRFYSRVLTADEIRDLMRCTTSAD